MVYQNYHKHSYYSNVRITDSVVSYGDYANRAIELGHTILSSVEHGWQGRYIECYELAKKNNLKFLFGTEAYYVKDNKEKDRTNCHIILLAKNETGRKAINLALSEANKNGFYYQPRIDDNTLFQLPKDDVWVTTACIGGVFKYDNYLEILHKLKDYFGSNFFLEIQAHNTTKQIDLNKILLELHRTDGFQIIVGTDSHYITPETAWERDELLVSRNMKYEDEEGWFMDYPSGDDMMDRFKKQNIFLESEIESAMSNTNIFLQVEEYDSIVFDNENVKMPSLYKNLTQEQKNEKFEKLVWEKWENELVSIPDELRNKYIEEIKFEVDIVKEISHSDYFLIDYEIVKDGIANGGHITKSGRGSGVSFYINKLLGLTDIDRISSPVKLYPERFLSKTRVLETKSLADIDLNLGNPEVFAASQEKIMGKNHAQSMIAYGTYKVKSAWKMFAKSQNVDFEISNAVTAQIDKYEQLIKHAETDEEREEIHVEDYIGKEYKEIFEKSKKYRGIVASVSPHPCAFLLTDLDIDSEVGLMMIKSGKKETLCSIMDGDWAEKYKFLKNDLLTVNVVSLIKRLYERIGIPEHSVQELWEEFNKDSTTCDIYRNGWTIGINQIEQSGTSARCRIYNPTNISELSSFVAAIRPGFKSMYKRFENREDFAYGIPAIDNLIRTEQFPQSFMLYQEQAMAILGYAGIPMDLTYEVIKSISKKRVAEIEKYKSQFLNGMTNRIIDDEHSNSDIASQVAHSTWQIIEDSTRYSFNACVSGDTKIKRTTSAKYHPTIEEMYLIKNSIEYAKMTGHIHLHKKYKRVGYGSALSMYEDDMIRQNKIIDIYFSGTRKVYKVTTENGSFIVCTDNHKFPTICGNKQLSELDIGDPLYTQCKYGRGILTVLSKISSIEYIGERNVYDIEMQDPAHNFISESGLVTCNSHSLSVATDSLYCAYLKRNYPLEFYETYIKLMMEKNKKDKIIEAQKEASSAFGISFMPFRFGQDNTNVTIDKEKNRIYNSLSTVKEFSNKTAIALCRLKDKKYNFFIDLLIGMEKTAIDKGHILTLIKLDYFSQFGNINELLRVLGMYTLFNKGNAKRFDKEKVGANVFLLEIISKHSLPDNKKLKSFQIINCIELLYEVETYIKSMKVKDISPIEKVSIRNELLGYLMPTFIETDRPILILQEKYDVLRKSDKKKFGISAVCQSLGSGKTTRYTIFNGDYKRCGEITKGDLIICKKYTRNGEYYAINDYEIIQRNKGKGNKVNE